MERGKFIAIEGIGGSGKSTIMIELVARVVEKGVKVWGTREQTNGLIGCFVDDIVRRKINIGQTDPTAVQFLFLADRIDHGRVIEERLGSGVMVVTDRYSGSTIAYGGEDEGKLSMFVDIQERLMQDGIIVRPDLTVLVDVSAKIALERRGKRGRDRDHFASMEREGTIMVDRYRRLAKELGWVKIDGEASIFEVTTELIGEIEARGFYEN